MKKFSIIYLFLVFIACSKVEYEKNEIIDDCTKISNLESFLVGKWQLKTRQCNHTNSINCAIVGSNWYDVDVFPTNYIIEVLPSGKINILQNNQKVQSFLATKWIQNVISAGELTVNCGNNKFHFFGLSESDSLSNIEIGTTIKIINPYIDLNFENYPVVSKCVRQHYIKIE